MEQKCRDIQDRLSAYLEGELEIAETQSVRAHLDSCSDCSRELENLRRMVSALHALPDVPPRHDVVRNVLDEIEREGTAKGGVSALFKWRYSIAAGVLVLVIAAVVGHQQGWLTGPEASMQIAKVTDGTYSESTEEYRGRSRKADSLSSVDEAETTARLRSLGYIAGVGEKASSSTPESNLGYTPESAARGPLGVSFNRESNSNPAGPAIRGVSAIGMDRSDVTEPYKIALSIQGRISDEKKALGVVSSTEISDDLIDELQSDGIDNLEPQASREAGAEVPRLTGREDSFVALETPYRSGESSNAYGVQMEEVTRSVASAPPSNATEERVALAGARTRTDLRAFHSELEPATTVARKSQSKRESRYDLVLSSTDPVSAASDVIKLLASSGWDNVRLKPDRKEKGALFLDVTVPDTEADALLRVASARLGDRDGSTVGGLMAPEGSLWPEEMNRPNTPEAQMKPGSRMPASSATLSTELLRDESAIVHDEYEAQEKGAATQPPARRTSVDRRKEYPTEEKTSETREKVASDFAQKPLSPIESIVTDKASGILDLEKREGAPANAPDAPPELSQVPARDYRTVTLRFWIRPGIAPVTAPGVAAEPPESATH